MSKHTLTLTRITNSKQLPYLWLALAAILFVFYDGRWAFPLAAWLAPLFLLRFVRSQRPLIGFLLAWLVRFVIVVIIPEGSILLSGIAYDAVVLLLTGLTMLPYLADRLLAPQRGSFISTLIFPIAFTTFEYLSSFGPSGTLHSIAYTQYGNLPLLQIVSVTGIWGLTFLLTWFASVVNWAWERHFTWQQVRGGLALYVTILAVVLLGGGTRLALLPPSTTVVRVAGLSASQAAVATLNQHLSSTTLSLLLSGKATQADRAQARSAFNAIDQDLLSGSQQQARAGAKIVVWPEASPVGANILQEDEPALLQQASTLARQTGIYLDMGIAVFLPDGGKGPFLKDESVLIDPTGQIVWTYEKTHLVPFGEQGQVVQGNGKVPMVESPYGRLAGVICYDADYPSMMRQAGQAGADLMFVPGDDWQAIDPYHTQIATFRAIENGYALVREASKGLSMAVDSQGRVLATSDYFSTHQQIMVAAVPIHGVRTIYATIGDLFAWLCIIGLLAFIGQVIIQRHKQRAEATVATLPEPQPTC